MMKTQRITAKAIENMKPGNKRREVPDPGCAGLYLIVQPSGRKSWAVRYRFAGKTRKLTLAGFPNLADARAATGEALKAVRNGTDPAQGRVVPGSGDTVRALAADFLRRHVAKKRAKTIGQYSYIIDTIVLPAWGNRNVRDIRKRDVVDLLDAVAETRPILANRTLAVVSRFFRWMAERDVIEASPITGVKAPTKETARDRVLSDDEIIRLWRALDGNANKPMAACLRVLLLCGQRRTEVSDMRRSELTPEGWLIPASRTKAGREHLVPLPTRVLDLLPMGDDLVFTGHGAFSRPKPKIDATMKPDAPWRIHDLRRTAASGMARLGIRPDIVERVLNHATGSKVARTYNRHAYISEKAHALATWADHVLALVGDEPATTNVVRMRRQVSDQVF
jgi:integrase